MRDFPNLTDREIKFYFANLVLAIEFLHTHNIVHCDVKPENLVIGADGYLMLTDFGLAQTLHSDDSWNRMGTLEYMSPEVLSDDPLDTIERRVSGDWWAAAVSLFEMKTLAIVRLSCPSKLQVIDTRWYLQPFPADSAEELDDMHKNRGLAFPPDIRVHEGLKELLFRMLHYDLPHRLGATEVPEGKNGSLINREIRRHKWMESVNWDRIERKIATVRAIDSNPLAHILIVCVSVGPAGSELHPQRRRLRAY